MARFSRNAQQSIETFVESLGLALPETADGSYSLEFSRSGLLSLVPSDDGRRVIVCLAREYPSSNVALEARLLGLAGFDPAMSAFVHAGTGADRSMVLAVDLEDDRFDSQTLDYCLSRLIELHDSLS